MAHHRPLTADEINEIPPGFATPGGFRCPPRASKPFAIAHSSHKLARLHLGAHISSQRLFGCLVKFVDYCSYHTV